jgi:hypothetical protein
MDTIASGSSWGFALENRTPEDVLAAGGERVVLGRRFNICSTDEIGRNVVEARRSLEESP